MAETFVCAGCGATLTAPLSRVALPVHARQRCGHELLPVLMEQGTYAVDPEPSGPPWKPWAAVGAEEAAARGVYAPVPALSYGAAGAVAVAPGDTRGTALIPERCDGPCFGTDGRDGPNLACEECGRAVATRIDDCGHWQVVWLDPRAVCRLPATDPTERTGERAGGRTGERAEEWTGERPGTPPVDPSGHWSLAWTAGAGAALAHLLAASEGAPVTVPGGLLGNVLGRALDALLPPGPPGARAALAGPGLPDPTPAPGIVLVPVHPRTGRTWRPPGGTAVPVPLPDGMWTHLAFHNDRLFVPATGGLPRDVQRDDPLPPHPRGPFQPDPDVFLHTLARLPAVRLPWLRDIYDRVRERPYSVLQERSGW
ncbi:hypothetical protein ACFU6R_00855 [Streptomyces sp. NPDC057499]|uniref:hypothetical protein n=1 Tax=Streptomyces sp. NPDC057499 TaxID=3346150 RepID=UPI003686373E